MVFLALWLSLPLESPQPCNPEQIFSAVRAATGADRWARVGAIIADGRISHAGLEGPMHSSTDIRSGRNAQRSDLPLIGEFQVFDGSTLWIVNGEGGVHPLDAPDAAAGARTDAYLARNGFFSPSSDPAEFECREDGAGRFDVVRVTPRSARPVDVWVERDTHRIARTVQRAPTHSIVTTLMDYRNVDGLVLPFTLMTADDDGSNAATVRVAHFRILQDPPASEFVRPPEPVNFRMNRNANSTTVALATDNGILSVNATINGQGPFPFVLDTGGHAILTLDSVRALNLTPIGNAASGGGGEGKTPVQYTQSRSIRIGDAELLDVPMTVLGIHGDGLGPPPAGAPPFAGILGLEIFERFAVRVDYLRKTLTLTPLATFHYRGSGVPIPLVFQDDEPLVHAQADGVDGLFGVDTGNSGATVLFGPFLEKNGFFTHYKDGIENSGSGAGGEVHGSTQALGRLTIAGQTFHNFLASFVVQKRGSFSSSTEAGNIGTTILSQFTLTFDYRDETIYFERESGAPVATLGRSGFFFSKDADGLLINSIVPNSPAASAGLAIGDHLVTINGMATTEMTTDAVRALTRAPVGTKLSLRVAREGAARDITLILRDVLCPSIPEGCSPWVEPAG